MTLHPRAVCQRAAIVVYGRAIGCLACRSVRRLARGGVAIAADASRGTGRTTGSVRGLVLQHAGGRVPVRMASRAVD